VIAAITAGGGADDPFARSLGVAVKALAVVDAQRCWLVRSRPRAVAARNASQSSAALPSVANARATSMQ